MTTEIRRSQRFSKGRVTLSANLRRKGASPTNHCWCQKTRVICLSFNIKISAVHCLVLLQSTHVIDGQTDIRTELRRRRPRAVKSCLWCECLSLCVADYRNCTMQMLCSQRCVRAYLRRYARECTRGRTPTCEDYSRVHNGGPDGCRHSDTMPYWNRVKRCCGADCSNRIGRDQSPSSSKASISVYMQMILSYGRRYKRL